MSVVEDIDRRVRIGGATRSRSILGGRRSLVDWVGMIACTLGAVSPLVGGSIGIGSALVSLVGAGASVAAWTPWPGMQQRSAVRWALWWAGYLTRRRRARSVFALARGGQAAVPQVLEPLIPVELPGGAGALRHASPGRKTFYSLTWEMLGAQAGFDKDYLLGADQQRFGRLLAALVRSDPRIFGVQEVSRVGAYDMADHVHWIAGKIPDGTSQLLIDSYVELLDIAGENADQTRTWLVARVHASTGLSDQDDSNDGGGEGGELAWLEQIAVAVEQLAGAAGLALRALTPARLAAVVRGLQDPDRPLDQGAGMTWEGAWAPWETWHPTYLVVHGRQRRWWTRTAVIPPDAVTPGLLPADFLWPLIGSMTPTLVRTVSTHLELVPADKLRSRLESDVSSDAAALSEAAGASTDDGSTSDQLSLSQQHLVDLKPGAGHQGAGWAAAITIQARSRAELKAATRQIRHAANEASIRRLDFVDGWHEGAFTTTMPLGHGMGKAR